MDSLALLGIISVAVWLLALLNSHLLVVLNSIVSKWQRLDIISRVVTAVMTIIAVVEAQKSVPQNTESSLIALMRLPAPTVEATVSDLSSVSLPEEFQSVTNLCFWGIAKNDDSVSLGIAWPDWMRFTNDFLDIFSNNQCSSNGWQRLAQLNVAQISSNAIVEFPYETMPTNSMRQTAFFRLASQDDSDNDGLSDKVESWVLGTNPLIPDTDNDGLVDGEEVERGANPKYTDTDSDGLADADEVGYIRVLDNFIWVDTSQLAPSYNTGYYFESANLGMFGWWCKVASVPISSIHILRSLDFNYVNAFETGYISFSAAGDSNAWIFPPAPTSLNNDVYNSGSILIAPYWNDSYLYKNNTNSYIKAGTVEDGSYVVEFHDVKKEPYSKYGMTYQIIVPPGTGNVIRVSYHSSDYWLDGEGAIVGVQHSRILTTNGFYNLSWDFSKRGPILPRTTIEYYFGYGTSVNLEDTDGDGLDDQFEIENSHGSPHSGDGDNDGLNDQEELLLGTNPLLADSDGDSLPDKWEVGNQLNPTLATGVNGHSGDLDNDGLTNNEEFRLGIAANNPDTDGDGINDNIEIALDSNPKERDTDGDGLLDNEELSVGTNLLSRDSDFDGLSDATEISIGTNPLQPDTDGDGLNDAWEYGYINEGFSPFENNSTDNDSNNDAEGDIDGDGLTNVQECIWKTNPALQDTDGDGVNDLLEIGSNSDPTDSTDLGVADTRIPIELRFGDSSSSNSEKYMLEITPVSGDGVEARKITYINENYGECETRTAMLVPGWKYELRLYHASSNGYGEGFPDYDYELSVVGVLPQLVTLLDPMSLFGSDNTSGSFAADGKVATISVHKVAKIAICSPEDSSWSELEESRVVLDDEELRIKIEITPPIQTIQQCYDMFGSILHIKTSKTRPDGVDFSIVGGARISNYATKSEIRISKTRDQLKGLGLLPSVEEDGINEMAWMDVPETEGQNLSDSDAFSLLNCEFRGRAIDATTSNFEVEPPISQRSLSFLRSAGNELVEVNYSDVKSCKRQIMNQADYFYFSGHGHHRYGLIDEFRPEEISNYWGKDLDCVIFAGCSVLDINDYNNNFLNPEGVWNPEEHTASPGKLWEAKGPRIMLGYAYSAPGDGGGAPQRIVNSWRLNRAIMGDVDAWMKANAENRAWHACAILKNQKYVYFKSFFFKKFKCIKEVNKGDW